MEYKFFDIIDEWANLKREVCNIDKIYKEVLVLFKQDIAIRIKLSATKIAEAWYEQEDEKIHCGFTTESRKFVDLHLITVFDLIKLLCDNIRFNGQAPVDEDKINIKLERIDKKPETVTEQVKDEFEAVEAVEAVENIEILE